MMATPVRRKLWMVLALTVALFLLYSAIGERGLIRLHSLLGERDALRSRVHSLKQSNVLLTEEVRRLRDDPATIEHLARTELGMVREDETVYILPARPGDKPK